MKPAAFDYFAPEDAGEALALLAEHGADARLLAGGQSLVPVLNFRLARPAVIVDLNRLPDFAYVRDDGADIALGAMTRHRAIEGSDTIAGRLPLLREAAGLIGHLPIRSRGTIGGSLANADPAAELPAVAVALDAVMVLHSRRGERRLAAGEFFTGALSTALAPDELLTEVRLPAMAPGSGWAFAEISRRHGDFALAGVAAQITLVNGAVGDVRLAACGVGPGPVRLADAEDIVRRDGIGEPAIQAAAQAAAAAVDPHSDQHGSAGYRRRLAAAMTARALGRAAARARGGAA